MYRKQTGGCQRAAGGGKKEKKREIKMYKLSVIK